MPPENTPYWQEWLLAARRDWRRVSLALSANDASLAAFLLQQCLEKYLKAFLLRRGWQLRRLHLLTALLEEALRFDSGLARFRDLCERVSAYYLVGRYPLMGVAEPNGEDVLRDRTQAAELIRALHPTEDSAAVP